MEDFSDVKIKHEVPLLSHMYLLKANSFSFRLVGRFRKNYSILNSKYSGTPLMGSPSGHGIVVALKS